MAAIDDLIAQIDDTALRARLLIKAHFYRLDVEKGENSIQSSLCFSSVNLCHSAPPRQKDPSQTISYGVCTPASFARAGRVSRMTMATITSDKKVSAPTAAIEMPNRSASCPASNASMA